MLKQRKKIACMEGEEWWKEESGGKRSVEDLD